MPLLRAAAYLLCFFALLGTTVQADVFMRIGSRPERTLEQAGGRPVYQADVHVNGQPANLVLMGFDRSAGELAPLLAHKLGLPVPATSTVDGARIAGLSNGHSMNLILLPGGKPDTTLALLVDQRAADAARANTRNVVWPDLPHPVAATPVFSAVNLATHTTLTVATATATPEALQAEMQAGLQSDGWQTATPHTQNGGLVLYKRGNAIMLVFTQTLIENGQTQITLLQRLGHTP